MRRKHVLDSIKAEAAITERAGGTLERRTPKNHSERLHHMEMDVRNKQSCNNHNIGKEEEFLAPGRLHYECM